MRTGVVALTDAGVQGKQVAAAFGLSAESLDPAVGRGRTGRRGWRRRGRPPKLTAGQVAKARGWAAEGVTQTEIARRLSVSRPVICELLARLGPAPQQPALPDAPVDAEPAGPQRSLGRHRGRRSLGRHRGRRPGRHRGRRAGAAEDAGPVSGVASAA